MLIKLYTAPPMYLYLDKLSPALESNLDEGVAGHVLHPLVCLVHELEQLVDDGLQEPPVGPEEPRVLADNVHDVGGDDGLVVLPLLLFAQPQQVLRKTKLELVHSEPAEVSP